MPCLLMRSLWVHAINKIKWPSEVIYSTSKISKILHTDTNCTPKYLETVFVAQHTFLKAKVYFVQQIYINKIHINTQDIHQYNAEQSRWYTTLCKFMIWGLQNQLNLSKVNWICSTRTGIYEAACSRNIFTWSMVTATRSWNSGRKLINLHP